LIFYLELKNNTIQNHFTNKHRHQRAMEEASPRLRVKGGKLPWSLE